MSAESELERTDRLIAKGEAVLKTHRPNPPGVFGFPTLDSSLFAEWRTQCLSFLRGLLGDQHAYVQAFEKGVERGHTGHAQEGLGILRAVREDLETGHVPKGEPQGVPANPLLMVEKICARFHNVARQLRSRHESRPTLDVQDEYDVQDLLHALLRVEFEDVRPEEYSPSYAGKSSRLDFLLKREQIVVEAKKTRPGLGAKEVASQLIEDIDRYKVHPDCKAVVCFVYDPEGLIANPRGVEADLSRDGTPFPVRVLIRPE